MLKHCGFAAEQMRHTRDVEKEAVRRVAATNWRKTVAPIGDIFQKREIGFFVGGNHRQRLDHGAGMAKGWPR